MRRTIASITIQPMDGRPLILRRWSATADVGSWMLGDLGGCGGYWRARSKRRLVAKAVRELRRRLHDPVVVVRDQNPLHAGFPDRAGSVGSRLPGDVVPSGAGGA